jgi:hypothetical protein
VSLGTVLLILVVIALLGVFLELEAVPSMARATTVAEDSGLSWF